MFKHDKDIIFLNGLKIPLKVFKMLEPSYQYPKDLVVMFYDGNRKIIELSMDLGALQENVLSVTAI